LGSFHLNVVVWLFRRGIGWLRLLPLSDLRASLSLVTTIFQSWFAWRCGADVRFAGTEISAQYPTIDLSPGALSRFSIT